MQFQNLRNSRETEISKFCNAEVNNFCFLKHVVGELCHLLLSVFRSKMHLQYFSIFFQFYIIRFNGYFCKHLWLISYLSPVTLKEWIAARRTTLMPFRFTGNFLLNSFKKERKNFRPDFVVRKSSGHFSPRRFVSLPTYFPKFRRLCVSELSVVI